MNGESHSKIQLNWLSHLVSSMNYVFFFSKLRHESQTFYIYIYIFGDSQLNKKNMHHPRVYGSNAGLHFKALKTAFYGLVAQKHHFSSLLMKLNISPSHTFLPVHLHHDIKFTTYIFLACCLSEKAHLFANALTGGGNCTWETPECHFLSFQGACFRGTRFGLNVEKRWARHTHHFLRLTKKHTRSV